MWFPTNYVSQDFGATAYATARQPTKRCFILSNHDATGWMHGADDTRPITESSRTYGLVSRVAIPDVAGTRPLPRRCFSRYPVRPWATANDGPLGPPADRAASARVEETQV